MKKKSFFTSTLSVVAIIVVVIAIILLLADRTLAKSFFDVVPNYKLFESCRVIFADGDKMLTNDNLDELVSQLEQLQYYKRGPYDDVMVELEQRK